MGRSPQRGDAAVAVAFAEESDVHERLIQSSAQSQSKSDQAAVTVRVSSGDEYDDDSFTHEELLHSIGSFSAVIWPVALTMVIARCV